MAEREMPTGVKVISVLYYISAIGGALFALFLLMTSMVLSEDLATQITESFIAAPAIGTLGSGSGLTGMAVAKAQKVASPPEALPLDEMAFLKGEDISGVPSLSLLLAGVMPLLIGLVSFALLFFGSYTLQISIFTFFVARGLWHGQGWARHCTLALSIFGIIMPLLIMIKLPTLQFVLSSIISIIYSLIIFLYLMLSKEVKLAFGAEEQ